MRARDWLTTGCTAGQEAVAKGVLGCSIGGGGPSPFPSSGRLCAFLWWVQRPLYLLGLLTDRSPSCQHPSPLPHH